MADPAASAVRVLLLARAGEARQRLESALADAGAQLLRSIDPAEGDPGEIIALRPAAVLVALEPAIEDSLERYDALLSDPGVLVMFDEADVAARRDGWDAARWVRHLAAKLNGHEDVLPPGTESEDAVHPAPGRLPERGFDPASVDIVALADVAQDLAAEVPRGDGFDPARDVDEEGEAGADTGLRADAGAEPEPEPEPEPEQDASAVAAAEADARDTVTDLGFAGLVAAEDMDWSSSSATYEATLAEDPALAELLATSPQSVDADRDDTGLPDADEALSFDLHVSLDGIEGEPAPHSASEDARDDAPAAVDPLSLGDRLSLADDDAPIATPTSTARIDLDALEFSFAGLSLADPDSYGHGVQRGAVMVEAGLGGPDAVRQLLGGLDETFGRAVLVRLQLDGGRYDRLVQQMQRATSLPVALAEAGAPADAGTVYFLPPDVAVVDDRARLVFATTGAGNGNGYAALPATDSALVFLSGASMARVDDAMAHAAAGALVLAQAPDSCYDGAAVAALVARGAVAAEPGDLAQALIDRWP